MFHKEQFKKAVAWVLFFVGASIVIYSVVMFNYTILTYIIDRRVDIKLHEWQVQPWTK